MSSSSDSKTAPVVQPPLALPLYGALSKPGMVLAEDIRVDQRLLQVGGVRDSVSEAFCAPTSRVRWLLALPAGHPLQR